ncbi:radical SAM/SPASM domain-containing protein [Alkaliphilus peptidifermentans]|uniref:Radical SAM superfamily enzyme, MoaA/NifB/PqqE/SkfB family n=1 Tax=Alkaliphilus peptidifermentans DSM 18978 TaxID=1120976 RepID=A0A1G5I997_9FIRM|nr:radical SAM protein [Alkaliphilus peptidifermentans]SCY72623.1 Radical SAM superfamily enzyme, MoaA/NifB/PqqE/SkfB family [Alkaliphilus peptidifermentans DSM 18978]
MARYNQRIINLGIRISVFIHYFISLVKGELNSKEFITLLKRLNHFINIMSSNKYIRINGGYKIDLYVPAFPSKAFYTACDKFIKTDIFGEFPCSTVLVSITSACRFKCKHCYQGLDKGKDLDIELLVNTIRRLQDMGIAFFNIEGGDPFLKFDRLKRVCKEVDNRSVIWVNSTGDGINNERIHELKRLNVKAIMFSVHSTDEMKVNDFMSSENAWDIMTKGMEICRQEKMPIAINACLREADFRNDSFDKLMEFAKDQGVAVVQLIKPKAAGAWLNENFDDEIKSLEYIKSRVNQYNDSAEYKGYPSISAQIIEEDEKHFGCTAGGTDRFYINAKGDIQPCEFLNISFGNLIEEDFDTIYSRMKESFKTPKACWLCDKYSKDIYEVYSQNALQTLPLDKAHSENIYKNWDRGKVTCLYEDLKKK